MARYTHSLTIATSLNRLHKQVTEVLTDCNYEVIFQNNDYLMARERPGKIPFARLVSVEVLIDSTRATEDKIKLTFVAKNEELPLQRNNHCHQMYDSLSQAVSEYQDWILVEDTEDRIQTQQEPMQVSSSPDLPKPIHLDNSQEAKHSEQAHSPSKSKSLSKSNRRKAKSSLVLSQTAPQPK